MWQTEIFAGLSPTTVKWLRSILKEYDFDDGEKQLLRRCGELQDHIDIAANNVRKHGLTFVNRFNETRPNPAIRIYQQSADLQARILKQLGVSSVGEGKENA